jgi:hypothetical protein
MHTWTMFMIAGVVVIDTIVFFFVLRRIRPRLMKLGRTMAERKETLAAAEAIVSGCLRESYSGDPDTLASVLAGVAPKLHDMLAGRGLEPDAEVVRDLLVRSLAIHGVPPARAQEALSQLAA